MKKQSIRDKIDKDPFLNYKIQALKKRSFFYFLAREYVMY